MASANPLAQGLDIFMGASAMDMDQDDPVSRSGIWLKVEADRTQGLEIDPGQDFAKYMSTRIWHYTEKSWDYARVFGFGS